MKFDEVHILFEQSGTFKKVFAAHGYKVTEYDIENTENVDFDTDIFAEIELASANRFISLFHDIHDSDLVLAFFPCTYFSDQSQLLSGKWLSLFHAFCLVTFNIAHSHPHKGGTRGQRRGKGPSLGGLGVSRSVERRR